MLFLPLQKKPFEILDWAASEQNVVLAQRQRIGEQISHQGD